MGEQIFVFAVLGVALGFFVWGRLRYDLVALSAAVLLVLSRIITPRDLLDGFGNDAVLSVVAIMIVGRAIRGSGVTEPFAAFLLRMGRGPIGSTVALTGSAGFFSAMMNNTGALTVFLPVAVHLARASHRLASSLLMPLAFSTLLGGMITLIGTPPNILVSIFRDDHVGEPFGLFDYTPVGLVVAAVGILFLSTVGWRLLPPRRGSVSVERSLRLPQFFAEVKVPEGSWLESRTLADLAELAVDVNVVGLVRGTRRIAAPLGTEPLEAGDLLLVECEANQLDALVARAGLEYGEDRIIAEEEIGSADVVLHNVVVSRSSPLVGRTPQGLRLRWRYGMNVLAISRRGARIVRRLSQVKFEPGDVLFVQVRRDGLEELLQQLQLPTLVDAARQKPNLKRVALIIGVFALAMIGVSTGAAPLGISFLAAALVLLVTRAVTVREAMSAVDWSIVVLLAATIPIGVALERSGGAETIAQGLLSLSQGAPVVVSLGALMIITMALSNVMNNAATAVLMAPIGYRLAIDMGASVDAFLMGVAVAASACFITPIGHQCNILVLGPGGYHFADYSRLGVPLSIIVVAVSLPVIWIVWGG